LADPLHQLSAEDTIGVFEHAVLQTDNDELRATELGPDEAANVLRMREIQRCIDFVKNVQRRWLELEYCQDER
jgi:hypothetical protein